jgi:hypothetical protein
MTSKWQEQWDYLGWHNYADFMKVDNTYQSDWNMTLYTMINSINVKIRENCGDCSVGVSIHPNLYDKLISKIYYLKIENNVRYPINLDANLAEDKVYVYDKSEGSDNIGEITITNLN